MFDPVALLLIHPRASFANLRFGFENGEEKFEGAKGSNVEI